MHDTVQVQNQVGNYPSRWDITGIVVEVKPHDQYVIKVHGSGRLTTRNRKFLKKITPYAHSESQNHPSISVPQIPLSSEAPIQVPHERNDDGEKRNEDFCETGSEEAVQDGDSISLPVTNNEDVQVPELRRSSRSRQEPDRLEVNWKSNSYEKQADIHLLAYATTCQSFNNNDYFGHSKSCGGGGFNGDGVVVSKDVQNVV